MIFSDTLTGLLVLIQSALRHILGDDSLDPDKQFFPSFILNIKLPVLYPSP